MSNQNVFLKIGEVAKLAKVSVRTLHHYDAIGLLEASHRSESGYRLYTQSDLERLQQILFYKTLEFPLEEIHKLMTDPAFNRGIALQQQRELINEKSDQLLAVLKLIDKTITLMDEDLPMKTEEIFEVFPEVTPEDLDEAQSCWGETEQHKESMRRFSKYSKDDLMHMKDENEAINGDLIKLMEIDIPADDDRVITVIERARLLIDKWSYPCSKALHMNLAEMYVSDDRFRESYEKLHPGLAEYVYAAVSENLNRA